MTDGAVPACLFARDTGAGEDAVVFLHGFGGSHAVWDDIASTPPAGLRGIAYDLPGHGGSLVSPAQTGTRAMAVAIVADLRRRGVGQARLVGHSLGGAVATLIAAAEPDLAASLLLLAPGGYGRGIDGDGLRAFAAARSAHEVHASLSHMGAPGWEPPHRAVDAIVASRRVDAQMDSLSRIVAWVARGNEQGAFPPAFLDAVVARTTVVWGTADPVLPFAQTAGLPSRFRLEPVDGAGHMLIEEAPEAVARAIAASFTG
jgi:pyruvate dehydrogenase E2 component (dihydrolipoamide acetyltransferase)